jgi:hypothetical protein
MAPIARLRLWAGVAAVSFGLALAAQQLIPVLYPRPPAPAWAPLRSADPGIREVEIKDGLLTVYADVTNAPDAAGNIDKAAATVLAAGRAIKGGVSDNLKGVTTVRFVFRCEAINRFGQDVMAALMTLDLPLPALTAADLGRMSGGDVLGLARSASLGAPGAYDALNAWCADAKRANAGFCAKAKGV